MTECGPGRSWNSFLYSVRLLTSLPLALPYTLTYRLLLANLGALTNCRVSLKLSVIGRFEKASRSIPIPLSRAGRSSNWSKLNRPITDSLTHDARSWQRFYAFSGSFLLSRQYHVPLANPVKAFQSARAPIISRKSAVLSPIDVGVFAEFMIWKRLFIEIPTIC